MNNPPPGDEGRLYAGIGRSKPAPQGICSVNSAGKVLAWALTFDDDPSVPAFLDYVLKRFENFPGAEKPVPAERFMRYPSQKMKDVEDGGAAAAVPETHPKGEACPGFLGVPEGTLVGRAYGRALKDGKPLAETRRQEQYIEDTVEVSVEIQEALVKAAAEAGGGRFRLPDELGRALVSSAFLGMLDVNPLGAPGGQNDEKQWEFWGRRDGDRVRLEGTSRVAGRQSKGGAATDGRSWSHEVRLTWKGVIETKGPRVTRLLAVAEGREKLDWANDRMIREGQSEVAQLPGGRPIHFDGDVRYGIEARPAEAAEIGRGAPGGLPARMKQLGAAVQAYAQSGGDLQSLQPEMEKLQRLLEKQEFEAAEKQIDRLMERVKKR